MTTDKAFKWRKCGRDLLMDERAMRLSTLALHLRLLFEILGHPDDAQLVAGQPAPGVGWLLDEYGDPYDTALIAALVHLTDVESVGRALAELERARIVVKSDTDAWGSTDHEERQLDPTTKRTRRARERSGNGPGTSGNAVGTVRERGGNGKSVPVAFPNVPEAFPNRQRTEDRGQRTDVTTTTPHAGVGVREETPPAADQSDASSSAPSNPEPPRTIEPPIGQRLAHARELVGTYTQATAAARADIPQGRLRGIESGVILPTRDDLERLARTYGDPAIATWPLPVRDPELVAEIVKLHRDLAIQTGAMAPSSPATPSAQDAAEVYATEAADLATGLTLRQAWDLVLSRAAEELRREVARGRLNGRPFYTLRRLAGPTRAKYLAATAIDLDRRDDLTPAVPSPGRRSRGPAPPVHPDQRTDGEISQ